MLLFFVFRIAILLLLLGIVEELFRICDFAVLAVKLEVDVIFVGGSLVPVGGHNVIEPALLGKPVVFGPHMHNFRAAAGLLTRAGGGIQVPDGAALVGALRALLVDEADRRVRGEAAWRAVSLHQGACQRTVDALAGLLEGRA